MRCHAGNSASLHRDTACTLRHFSFWCAGSIGVTALLSFFVVGMQPAALAAAAIAQVVGSGAAMALISRQGPMPTLGWCNVVTLGRLAITSALVAPWVAAGSTPVILALATLALLLDGVDGWLARRFHQTSDFGARFDMEVDAAFGMVLAVNAWLAGTVGPAVLLLGIPRYGFIAAATIWPWIDQPLPDRLGRKVVCVVQIGALIALQVPLVAGTPAHWIMTIAVVALGWSFGRDVLWLWRERR